jgi:hypothetical protein
MNSVAAVLKQRNDALEALKAKAQLNSTSSIEIDDVVTNITSIEAIAKAHKHDVDAECYECLPREIDDMVDNKIYRRKMRFLIKQGHLKSLYVLARMAAGKDNPKHWFARATRTTPIKGQESAPTFWERSLKFIAKLQTVQQTAERVAEKIKTEVTKGIYKMIWSGANVDRWADTAKEIGRDKVKTFMWYCQRELKQMKGSNGIA